MRYLALFLFISINLVSCRQDEEPGTLKVNFVALYNGQPFQVGEIYEDHLGHRIRVDDFKTYISDLYVLKADGSNEKIFDIELFDFNDLNSVSWDLDEGDYTGIQFGTGVPSDQNKDSDPNQYPNDHPLSVSGSQGMFWFWNTGYIFTKYEGKVDLEGIEGNDLLDPFAFHCGEDFLYQTHTFNQIPFEIKSDEVSEINVIFHVEDFLSSPEDSIDLALDFLTHTSGNVPLAERFNANFNKAIQAVNE